MGKKLILFFSMLVIACLLLAGCGQKQEVATDAGSGKDQAGQVIELKFHHMDPPNAFFVRNGLDKWAQMVEERTGGKVKIIMYPAETLGKAKDAYDMVVNGIADLAWVYVGNLPGRFPMTEVVTMPMLGIPSAEVGSKVLWDLYSQTPYLKDEYKGVKVITLHTHATVPICTSKKPIRTMEDLKGLKIRTPGGPPTEFMKQTGALPVTIPSPDIYENMQKGAIDGYIIDWHAIQAFHLTEVSKYFTHVKLYLGAFQVLMNQEKWNSLPADVQKAIEELSGSFAAEFFGKVYDESERVGTDDVKAKQGEIIQLSPEELQLWVDLAQNVRNKWVNDNEASGRPAKAVLEETVNLIKKYSK